MAYTVKKPGKPPVHTNNFLKAREHYMFGLPGTWIRNNKSSSRMSKFH